MGFLDGLRRRAFKLGDDSRAAAYGRVEVPGEARVTLPAGEVRFVYHESKGHPRMTSGSYSFDPPDELRLTVVAPDGTETPVERGIRDGGQEIDSRSDPPYSRTRIGRMKVSAPGEYVVRAGPELADTVEPAILVGTP